MSETLLWVVLPIVAVAGVLLWIWWPDDRDDVIDRYRHWRP